MKTKINLKNIKAYIQGKVRKYLYYSRFRCLLRSHIREQIHTRILSMDLECFWVGQCKLCGCETTALQMANKACDKPCYPKMLSKSEWQDMKKGALYIKDRITWKLEKDKFIIIKHE